MTSGHVFISISEGGRLNSDSMTDQAIRDVVAHYAEVTDCPRANRPSVAVPATIRPSVMYLIPCSVQRETRMFIRRVVHSDEG